MDKLTAAERGAGHANPSPAAILKWANVPIAMLGGIWEELRHEWAAQQDELRPPVFILVCKNTKIAKLVYEWLAEDRPPTGIPSAGLEGLLNTDGKVRTIRVDSKVVHETDSDQAKPDELRWMRFTLDTVSKLDWREIGEQGLEAVYWEAILRA